jgi:hypothetical protein
MQRGARGSFFSWNCSTVREFPLSSLTPSTILPQKPVISGPPLPLGFSFIPMTFCGCHHADSCHVTHDTGSASNFHRPCQKPTSPHRRQSGHSKGSGRETGEALTQASAERSTNVTASFLFPLHLDTAGHCRSLAPAVSSLHSSFPCSFHWASLTSLNSLSSTQNQDPKYSSSLFLDLLPSWLY